MSTESDAYPRQQRAEQLFKYGNDAALKNSYDYAIQMYKDACKLVPENLKYRMALRGIARRKFNNDPSRVGTFVRARTQPIKMRIGSAKSKKDWAHVLELCEEVFVHHPWDVAASRDMAEAAENLDLKELARFALESVHAQAGDDVQFLRHLGAVYELNEDWPRAIACWEKVRQLSPFDEDAKRKINGLAASQTISRSGLGAAVTRAEPQPSEALAAELDEMKARALTPEQRLRKEIESEPTRVGPYLELADLLRGQGQLDEAEKVLAQGIKANPRDNVLLSAHGDVQIGRLQRALRHWAKQAHDFPDDANVRSKHRQIAEKLSQYELREYRRRLALRPDDLNLRYQVGLRLAEQGQHDAAIAEFQQARSSPTLKVQALQQLGSSFEAKGLPKLAERNYLEAIKGVEDGDPGTLNDLNYRLAKVYEAMGNLAKAEEHYNEVAANDYGYRDVAQRLAELSQRAQD